MRVCVCLYVSSGRTCLYVSSRTHGYESLELSSSQTVAAPILSFRCCPFMRGPLEFRIVYSLPNSHTFPLSDTHTRTLTHATIYAHIHTHTYQATTSKALMCSTTSTHAAMKAEWFSRTQFLDSCEDPYSGTYLLNNFIAASFVCFFQIEAIFFQNQTKMVLQTTFLDTYWPS